MSRSRYRSRTRFPYATVITVAFMIVWGIIAANFSDTRPIRAAETFGFTNPHIVSSSIFFTTFKGCGVGDLRIWYVEAINSTGDDVSFIVCGGVFKANTVRVR